MEAAVAAVPAALREPDQWVVWREELRGDKTTKVPYCAHGGPASTTAPSTWSSFDEALEAAGGRLDRPDRGIGFVLSDGDPFVAIDLDGVRDAHSGELLDGIDELVDGFDTYAEASPSGTGVHVWLEGSLNGSRNRTGKVEMYARARYMTVTAFRLPGTPETIEPRQQALDRFYTATFGADPQRSRSGGSPSHRASTSTTTTSCSSGRSPTAASGCNGCSRATRPATRASRRPSWRCCRSCAAGPATTCRGWIGSIAGLGCAGRSGTSGAAGQPMASGRWRRRRAIRCRPTRLGRRSTPDRRRPATATAIATASRRSGSGRWPSCCARRPRRPSGSSRATSRRKPR